jgi:hypothetical protein
MGAEHAPRHQAAVFQRRKFGRDPQPAVEPTPTRTGTVRALEAAIEGGQPVGRKHGKLLGVDVRGMVSESRNR